METELSDVSQACRLKKAAPVRYFTTLGIALHDKGFLELEVHDSSKKREVQGIKEKWFVEGKQIARFDEQESLRLQRAFVVVQRTAIALQSEGYIKLFNISTSVGDSKKGK